MLGLLSDLIRDKICLGVVRDDKLTFELFPPGTKLTAEYTLQNAKMTEVGSYYIFNRFWWNLLSIENFLQKKVYPSRKYN